jgi:hypothetical protein
MATAQRAGRAFPASECSPFRTRFFNFFSAILCSGIGLATFRCTLWSSLCPSTKPRKPLMQKKNRDERHNFNNCRVYTMGVKSEIVWMLFTDGRVKRQCEQCHSMFRPRVPEQKWWGPYCRMKAKAAEGKAARRVWWANGRPTLDQVETENQIDRPNIGPQH